MGPPPPPDGIVWIRARLTLVWKALRGLKRVWKGFGLARPYPFVSPARTEGILVAILGFFNSQEFYTPGSVVQAVMWLYYKYEC